MDLIAEPLPGAKLLRPFRHHDERGEFVKTFHSGQFAEHGIQFSMGEEFFSISCKDTLRGMHFQAPPFEHDKLVYCLTGSALDVILDLRKDQETYGQAVGVKLSAYDRLILFIPIGFAHGFLSLEDNSCLVYKTSCSYAPDHDKGIRWNSFGFDWPIDENKSIISERDQAHPQLSGFNSPF